MRASDPIVSKWAGRYDAALTHRTYVHPSDDDPE